MKIDRSVNNLRGTGPAKTAERPATSGPVTNAPAGGASGPSGADVSLSPLATQLAQSDAGDVDVSRVAELQAAIRDGRLTINPDKIATGLLESARDLLNAQKPS